MLAEESPLSRGRLCENRFIKLKLIQIGRVFLCNHPLGIVNLQQVTGFVARIRTATMPDFNPWRFLHQRYSARLSPAHLR